MSSSGVESMISWNSVHSSLLPIPGKTWWRHNKITFQCEHIDICYTLHCSKTGFGVLGAPHRCWHSWSPGKPALPYSGWVSWHFSCGSQSASHQTRIVEESPRWWGWRWQRGRRRWACWTCSPCCWVWPPMSRILIRPPLWAAVACGEVMGTRDRSIKWGSCSGARVGAFIENTWTPLYSRWCWSQLWLHSQ